MNTDALEAVRSAVLAHYYVKVGIIGKAPHSKKRMATEITKSGKHKASKTFESPLTNVEIGFIHEYGSKSRNIERRSFLHMPLLVVKKHAVEKEMAALWNKVSEGKMGIKTAYTRLGVFAEKVVQLAFATRGFGHWKKLMHREGSPLIDTGQLRKSITSQVGGA